jgi:molecular chaperone DnaK
MAEIPEAWIGIDLGCSLTKAAMLLEGKLCLVEVASSFRHRASHVPTALYVEPGGKILVGDAAVPERGKDGARYLGEFKSEIGNPRGVVVSVAGSDRIYAWYELVAEILRHMRLAAQRGINRGNSIPSAVLTVPGPWMIGGPACTVMERAARHAGFQNVRILHEPLAAAYFYDFVSGKKDEAGQQGDLALIYDIGSTTFHPTLIRRSEAGYEMVAASSDGVPGCGGNIFDDAVRAHFSRQCPDVVQSLLPGLANSTQDPAQTVHYARDLHDLDEFLVGIKHRFSDSAIDLVEERPPIMLTGQYRLSRVEFEAMLSPLLDSTIQCCEELMRRNHVEWKNLSRVLLAGGSSQLQLVAEKLREAARRAGAEKLEIGGSTNGADMAAIDPAFAICYGAALEPHRHDWNKTQREAEALSAGITAHSAAEPPAGRWTSYRVEKDPFGLLSHKAGIKKEPEE